MHGANEESFNNQNLNAFESKVKNQDTEIKTTKSPLEEQESLLKPLEICATNMPSMPIIENTANKGAKSVCAPKANADAGLGKVECDKVIAAVLQPKAEVDADAKAINECRKEIAGVSHKQNTASADAEPSEDTRGWITPLLDKVVTCTSNFSELLTGKRIDYQDTKISIAVYAARARHVDSYVIFGLVLLIVSYAAIGLLKESHPIWCILFLFVIAFRIIELLSTIVRITLFDRRRLKSNEHPVVASYARIIVLGLTNYIELALGFASIYFYGDSQLISINSTPHDWFTPIYFSAATQMSMGYGELYPVGFLRVIVSIHGFAALLLLVFVVTRFVSNLRKERSLDGPENDHVNE